MKGFSMKVISSIGGDGIRQVPSDAAILSRHFESFILFHCVPKTFSRKTSTQCIMKGFSMKVISTIGDDGSRQVASVAAILSRVFEHFMLFHCVPNNFSRKTSTQCIMKGFSMKVVTRQKMKGFPMMA